jgi:hypothetical protein
MSYRRVDDVRSSSYFSSNLLVQIGQALVQDEFFSFPLTASLIAPLAGNFHCGTRKEGKKPQKSLTLLLIISPICILNTMQKPLKSFLNVSLDNSIIKSLDKPASCQFALK